MHKHLIRILFTGLVMLSMIPLFSQEVYFQRLFTSLDRQTINYGCEPTEDGGFYLLNFFSDDTEMRFGLNISKHDKKGNLVWTNDYELETAIYGVDFRRVDMVNTGRDTLVVSGLRFPDENGSDGNYMLKIEPGTGETVYSGLITNRSGVSGPAFWPKLINGFHEELNYLGSHIAFDSTFRLHLEKINQNNDSISSKSFTAIDEDGFPVLTALLDATNSMDSSSLVVSCISSPDELLESVGLLTIDSSSNITSAHKYSIDSIMYQGMQVFGMDATRDTGIVMTGSYVDVVTNNTTGFVFKTDSLGQVVWSKNIGSLTPFSISIPNSCLYTSGDEILVMGKSADLFTGELSDFAIFLDDEGNVLRQKLYSSENSFFLDLSVGLVLLAGELQNSPDGSILYSTTGIDLENGLVLSPLGIKMDQEGAAVCEDTLNVELLTDISIIRDTLIMVEDNVVDRDTITVDIVPFNDYDLPILTLLDTFFCPQDPVMATLNATLENATSYLWSTGDTTPTLFVTEEGEYQVTVTLDDRICYMLCDTSNISVRDFPEANISPDLSVPCQVTLAATSTTDIALAVWSTGDTINNLVVTEPGDYSVTITDSCDNQAQASITIGPAVFTPVIDFTLDDSRLCEFGELLLTATSTIPAAAYQWSTGETTETITVSTPGDYSVTVTDICGETGEASISFDEDSFVLELEVGINRDYSRLCEFAEMRLWAEAS
ncbi:MAG: hypothetical protein KJO29_01565, partial [Bacteroidia bacterium]|nr:hypothetical protein [Bacteroidia bacterium]